METEMPSLKKIEGNAMDEARLQELNVERLLVGFLRSLLSEQRGEIAALEAPHADPEVGGHA
jgi:hypothetical protein